MYTMTCQNFTEINLGILYRFIVVVCNKLLLSCQHAITGDINSCLITILERFITVSDTVVKNMIDCVFMSETDTSIHNCTDHRLMFVRT